MDKQALAQMIALYLQLNPTPSDAQFHQLAAAIGIDHETLEAVAYQMLGEEVEGDEVTAAGDEGLSESQEVLDGDYDPQTTTTDDLALNDGAPAGTSSQQGNQDATLNDGVSDTDVGIDMGPSDQDSTIADGIAPVQLRAAVRLGLIAATRLLATTYQDCDDWERAVLKKYPNGEVAPDHNDPNDRNLIAYADEDRQKRVGYFRFTGSYDDSTGSGSGSLD